ncbi:hypothetical protein HQN90_20270 [Paenibacillus alba]|uniref:hypothetical protein n=1 Tax=Paenibacillus alba TaxID=1197127 RepID=UPI0015637FAB|nr:hypothetical protein [Paenibacillus alba]NQX68464.1 hypothetical protein [Paenibacillus alba]
MPNLTLDMFKVVDGVRMFDFEKLSEMTSPDLVEDVKVSVKIISDDRKKEITKFRVTHDSDYALYFQLAYVVYWNDGLDPQVMMLEYEFSKRRKTFKPPIHLGMFTLRDSLNWLEGGEN